MTSSIINFIVDKYLSNILEINKDETKSSLWSGEFEMSNLKIKNEIFTNLNLPYFELVNGYIGTLKIKLQLPRFYMYPIIVNIDKVFFHARQKKLEGLNKEIEIKNMEIYKDSKLQNAEELMSQVNQFQNENPGMSSQIINNLIININDIFIKYDDELSYPEKPFSFGILMKQLKIRTTDKNFTEVDDNVNTIPYNVVNFKMIKLTNLSMFMDIYNDKNQMPYEQYIIDNEKTVINDYLIKYLKDKKDFYKYCLTEMNIKINDENAHSYLLFNLGLTLKTALNDNLKLDPSPKALANCELGEIKMALSLIQISLLMNLLSYINLNAMYQIGLANNYYTKKLTKEQQNSYVENYITYYELKYKKEKLNLKEAERMKEEDLKNVENGLRYDTIQAMRDAALIKISHSNEKENIRKKITQLKGGTGFFSYFASGPNEEEKKEIQKLEKKLSELEDNDEKIDKEAYEMINNSKNEGEIDFLRDVKDSFVLYKVELKLPKCILKIPENDDLEMIDLVFKDFKVLCDIKKKGQFFGLYVDDLTINQYQLKNSVFKTLLETVEQKADKEDNNNNNDNKEKGSALTIEFINDPSFEKCDYKFIFKNKKRLIITLNLYSLQYFSSKIMTNLNTSIGKNDVMKYVQGEIGSYINKGMKLSEVINQGNYNHFNIDLDIEIKSPLLLFPQNIIDEKNNQTILISFGDLKMYSILPPRKNKNIDYLQFNDVNQKNTLYDVYKLDGNNFYMSTIKNYDGNVANLTSLEGLYLLENVTLNFVMFNIIEPQNKFFENFKIEITISDVNFNLTDSQMIFFINLLDSLSRINKKIEIDLLSDLKFEEEEKKEEEKKEEEKKEEEKKEEEKKEEEKKEEEKKEEEKKEEIIKKGNKPTFIFIFNLTKVKFAILKTISLKEREILQKSSDEKIHNKKYKEYLSFSMEEFIINLISTEKGNMNVELKINSINMKDIEVQYLSENKFEGESILYQSFQNMIGTESEIDKIDLFKRSISRVDSVFSELNESNSEINTNKKKSFAVNNKNNNPFITIFYNYLFEEKKQFVYMDMSKLKLCFPLPTLAKLYQFYQYYFGIYSKKMRILNKFLQSEDLKIENYKKINDPKYKKKKVNEEEEEDEKEDDNKEIDLENKNIEDFEDNEISTSKKNKNLKEKKKNLLENTKLLKNLKETVNKDPYAKKSFISKMEESLNINIQNRQSKIEKTDMNIVVNMKEIEMSMPMEAEKDDTKVLLFKFNFMCKINMKSEYETIMNEFKEIEKINYHYNDMKLSVKIFNIDFSILNFIRGEYKKAGLCEIMLSDFRFLTNINSFLDFENQRNVMTINVNFEPMTINIGFRQIKTLQKFLGTLTQFTTDMNLPYDNPMLTFDNNSIISKSSFPNSLIDSVSENNSLSEFNSSINESTINIDKNDEKEEKEDEIKYNTSTFENIMDVICTIDKVSMRFLDNTSQYISPLLNIEMNKTSFKYISNSNPKGTKNIGFLILESVSQNDIPLKDYDPYNLYQYANANFNLEINFYNDKKNDWEPIVEKFSGEFLINQFAIFSRYRSDLISNDMLNINFSMDSVRVFNNVMKKFYQDEEDWDNLEKRNDLNVGSSQNSAIEVFNFTGIDVNFWLDADEKTEDNVKKVKKYVIKNEKSKVYYKNEIAGFYKKMNEADLRFKKDKFSFQFEGYSVIDNLDYFTNYVKSFIIMKEKEVFNDARSIRSGVKVNKKKEEIKENNIKNVKLIDDIDNDVKEIEIESKSSGNSDQKKNIIKEEEEDEINTDSIKKPLIDKKENEKIYKDKEGKNNENNYNLMKETLQVLVKVYQNGLTKTILLESNVSFYNNLQYPITLSIIPKESFMLDYQLNENNIDHLNNVNKIKINPNTQKSIPLNLVKSQSRIYAKIDDDNMMENNNGNYTLIYENFNFINDELFNLTEYDQMRSLVGENNFKIKNILKLEKESCKILPLKKNNENYFVSIDFTVQKGLNEKIKTLKELNDKKNINNEINLYKDKTYNTFSYIFIIGQCFVLENQIPYKVKIDLINNSKDNFIDLNPLEIKNVFDINPLDENGKIKVNLNYQNENFISDEINDFNNEEKIKLKNDKNEIIECNMKSDDNNALINIYDEKGLFKLVKNFTKRKKIILYFDYIINNKTDNEILIKDKSINEKDFKENITNKLFPKSISCININSNSANFKIGNSSWTKNTTLNTIGMSGELIFESKSEENDKNSLIKNLALIITSSSMFKNSFIILIEPRFMLVNKLPINLIFKQYDINKKNNDLFQNQTLEKGEMMEFKYIQTEKKMKKYIQISSENQNEFSCPFNIEDISDLNIKIPLKDDLISKVKKDNEEIQIKKEDIKKEKEDNQNELKLINNKNIEEINEKNEKIKQLEDEEKLLNEHTIYKINNKEYLLIKTSIATYDNGLIYIIFYSPKYSEYIISNETKEQIKIKQKKDKYSNDLIILNGNEEQPFVWGDLSDDEKLLIVNIKNTEIEIDFSKVEIGKITKKIEKQNFSFEIVIENNKRRKLIISSDKVKKKVVKKSFYLSLIKTDKKNLTSKFIINMKGFGLSIIDNSPREIFYISFYNLFLKYHTITIKKPELNIQESSTNIILMMKNFQIDYCLEDSFKSIIVPKKRINPEIEETLSSKDKYNFIPFFQLLLSISTSENLKTNETVTKYPQFDFTMQEMLIFVDQACIYTLLNLQNQLLNQLDFYTTNENDKKKNENLMKKSSIENIPSKFDKNLSPEIESPEQLMLTSENQSKIFMNYLFLSSIKITLTLRIDLSSLDLGNLPGILHKLIAAFGNTLAHISDCTLRFSEMVYSNVFTDIYSLSNLIQKHYMRQGMLQFYKVLGSLDMIGNPIGFVDKVGTGFFEFFNEPRKGFLKGPVGFGEGLAKGVGSLISNVIGGSFDVVGKITGTFLNFTQTLQGEKNIIQEKEPENFIDGMYKGIKGGFIDIGKGVIGVFKNPYEGMKNEGVKGLFKGIGSGILGVAVSPFSAAFRISNKLFVGLKNTANIFNDKIKSGRFRYPRPIEKNSALKSYDKEKAKIQAILNYLDDYDDEEIIHFRYFMYKSSGLDKNESLLILTNKNIIVVYEEKEVVFEINLKVICSVQVHDENLKEGNYNNSNDRTYTLLFILPEEKKKYIATDNYELCREFYSFLIRNISG